MGLGPKWDQSAKKVPKKSLFCLQVPNFSFMKKSRFCPKGPNFAFVASFQAKSQILYRSAWEAGGSRKEALDGREECEIWSAAPSLLLLCCSFSPTLLLLLFILLLVLSYYSASLTILMLISSIYAQFKIYFSVKQKPISNQR